jgi:hypothetical protein
MTVTDNQKALVMLIDRITNEAWTWLTRERP